MSLLELLDQHPFADSEGLVHTVDRSMTLGEVRSLVRTIASTIAVEPGRAIAVQLPNGPELLCTMFAVWDCGAVLVPLNDRLTSSEVDTIILETGAAAIIDLDGFRTLDGDRRYQDDVAFVVWTSGTTGAPKPILHTHTSYLELLDRVLGPLRGDGATRRSSTPNLIPVSMALNAGIYNCLFGLRAGAALVIMERFGTSEFALLVERHQIRSTVLPPAAMVMLNESSIASLAPLRYVRSITAPLSPLHARIFSERFGCFVLNSYGQAEMGEVIGWTAADAREHPEKIGAAGRPLPGVEVKVDGEGHLLVRPPRAALGLDERRDAEGFIDTGDLASIDESGFVWIDGRVSDVINRGGNKVFPDAVEEVLRLHRSVADVAVVGVPDDRLGEVPVAFVVGEDIDEKALITHCREHLVAYKIPVAFVSVDSLPRSEIGKVLRRSLVERWGADPVV